VKFSRTGWLCVAAACCATFGGLSTASAQAPGAASAAVPAAPKQVVVIDIAKVFKEFGAFNAEMESMKAEVDAYEEYLKGKQTELQALVEARGKFTANSPEYKAKDQEILQIQSQTSVEATTKRKEFMEREAQIYFAHYVIILQTIDEFAARNGITLVLRYNSEPIDRTNRQSIQQGVNNAIVFQRSCDITNFVIKTLNPPAAATAQGTVIPGAAQR
jgi:Skp family chaperone for outer membrane proteins